VTVNPAGTFGMAVSGLGTDRLGLGLAAPGAGSAFARGCGTTVFCCAIPRDAASTIPSETNEAFAADFIP
jgi:hypothetical protein